MLWNTGNFTLTTGDAVTGGIIQLLPTEQSNICTHRSNERKETTHASQINSDIDRGENKVVENLSESTDNVELKGAQQDKAKPCDDSGLSKRLQNYNGRP